jgi:hypothetical protein
MDPYSDDPGAAPTAVLEREVQEREATTHDRDPHPLAPDVRKANKNQAALGGTPVIALCGKVWVPGRDPDKYPVCPECKEIYEGIREPNDGDGGKGRGGGFRGLFGGRR